MPRLDGGNTVFRPKCDMQEYWSGFSVSMETAVFRFDLTANRSQRGFVGCFRKKQPRCGATQEPTDHDAARIRAKGWETQTVKLAREGSMGNCARDEDGHRDKV